MHGYGGYFMKLWQSIQNGYAIMIFKDCPKYKAFVEDIAVVIFYLDQSSVLHLQDKKE